MSEISTSRMLLLDKLFVFGVVASQLSDSLDIFKTTKPLYLLLSVRILNARYKQCNEYALIKFMRANRHTVSVQDLYSTLDLLVEHNYITRSKNKVYITIAGLAALNALELLLRKSTFRYRKNVAINIPLQGRKKKPAKIK